MNFLGINVDDNVDQISFLFHKYVRLRQENTTNLFLAKKKKGQGKFEIDNKMKTIEKNY